MDAPHPFQAQRQLLTPSRLLAVAFIAVSAVSAAWIVREEPTLGRVALLSGTPLPTSELALMEAAFDRAKLTDYSIERGRILVPKHRQSAYMRVLVDAQALPKEFGGSLRRALESNSPWQSRSVQEELLRVATQEELSLVLCSMPGVKRASVLCDSEERPGAGVPQKTASVSIETEDDASVSPDRMRAIRVLVAASIAGLEPARVAVTDLRSGRVFAGPIEADAALSGVDPALAAQASYEEHLAAKVRQAIGFVRGAIVDVSVVFESARAKEPPAPSAAKAGAIVAEAGANAPAEIAPPAVQPAAVDAGRGQGGPSGRGLDSVQASIAIPETYFQPMLERSAAHLDPRAQMAIEDREIARIRDHVLEVLPPVRDPAGRKVRVTTFPVITAAAFRAETSSAEPSSARQDPASAGVARPFRRSPAPTRDEPGAVSPDAPGVDAETGDRGEAGDGGTDSEVVRVRLPTALARLVSRGDGVPVSLPRESLLAGTSILFGVLSALFWIIGRPSSRATHLVLAAILAAAASSSAVADENASAANTAAAVEARDAEGPGRQPTVAADSLASMIERLFAGRSLGTSLSAMLLFGIASLAPAVLLMTTSFVRMSVVLSLVRQGIGTPHLPSNQVVTSLAIFLTALVMWPVWTAVWREGVEPYSEGRLGLAQAVDGGVAPLRRWMTGQIQAAGNADTLGFFAARAAGPRGEPAVAGAARSSAAEPPIEAVLPAFLVSELEVAFAIGLRLLVPFLVLDVVVATIVTAAGLVSLSPATVALPLKLLVFVVADGWTLIVKSLLDGFALVG